MSEIANSSPCHLHKCLSSGDLNSSDCSSREKVLRRVSVQLWNRPVIPAFWEAREVACRLLASLSGIARSCFKKTQKCTSLSPGVNCVKQRTVTGPHSAPTSSGKQVKTELACSSPELRLSAGEKRFSQCLMLCSECGRTQGVQF